MHTARGFSIIELTVTAAILAVLATVAFPMVSLERQRAHERELKGALREVRGALDAYKRAVDDGKIQKPRTVSGYPVNLEQLAQPHANLRDPSAPPLRFLRRVPRDPFRPPNLEAGMSWGVVAYISTDRRGGATEDVYDIFSLSPRLGLNGTPYRDW